MDYTLSQHASFTVQQRAIRAEWLALALEAPTRLEPDPTDPTLMHALRVVPEHGARVLRVIYNRTTTPPHVVTAFFDRGMKGKL